MKQKGIDMILKCVHLISTQVCMLDSLFTRESIIELQPLL